MFFLLKSMVFVALVAGVLYGAFIAKVGGQSVADHVTEVAGSEVVRSKVDLIREDLKATIEARLAEVQEKRGIAKKPSNNLEAINDADRASLDQLVDRSLSERKPKSASR